MQAQIRQAISQALVSLGAGEADFSVEHPADTSRGDYATNAALVAAKLLGKSPREVAEQLVAALRNTVSSVAQVEIAGPGFVNFYLAREFFVQEIERAREAGPLWGTHDHFKHQPWIIEHTSPNPNKAMHIGHLRNNITGMALVRLSEACGAEVVSEAIDNDRGIAIAKLMWGYLKFARKDGSEDPNIAYWHEHKDEWHTPETKDVRPDRFVDELYVKGNADGDASPECDQAIRALVISWEAHDEMVWDLWRTVLGFSYQGQAQTLTRLHNRWDRVWHEHEHYEAGKRYVAEGLEKGVFKKLEDGAILTNLESYGLSDTIVQKSDGTALYITQDIALTKLKKDTGAQRLMWVIGPDQSLAMKQLFAVCEQLGIGRRDEFEHIAYGYMSVKGQGKMSSRLGTVLYIDDVLDMTKEKVSELIRERAIGDKDLVAEQVALAAVKFSILKSGRMRDIAFDIDEATRLDGDSGPYLQYTHTRAVSVLKKAQEAGVVADTAKQPTEPYELEKKVYQFPEIVLRAAVEREPHYVSTYLLELAALFNAFYAHERIADTSDAYAPYKVALTDTVRQTLKNGLSLLGIDTPEEM